MALFLMSLLFIIQACSEFPSASAIPGPIHHPLFELTDSSETGFYFLNEMQETEEVNIFSYLNLFNGSGVAVGDLNNDGLPEIFMGGNLFGGRLFLNQGDFRFKQISESANVFFSGYTTGVTMADVNGDGFLDIYLCRSLQSEPDKRSNLLLINNQDLTFTEKALDFGINDQGYSNHATFFDMDRDGDLDLYVLNHRTDFEAANDIMPREAWERRLRNMTEEEYRYLASHLYENDGTGHFRDVTREAGLTDLSFGLSATASDINQDGWTDLYVACDHSGKDHLYLNNQDGTFTDHIDDMMGHISRSSMGADIADINNDGLPDIMVVDMMSDDPVRQRQLGYGVPTYDMFHLAHDYGHHSQIPRNCLQLNHGNGSFSEIGELAGVSSTDWSWSPLLADFDNDGNKDIFISNGYPRDITDQDFTKYISDSLVAHQKFDLALAYKLSQAMSSTPLENYLFLNSGGLSFKNSKTASGLIESSFSNGAAYADLDLDGDLDLIVNNYNHPAFLYRNRQRENNPASHYLQIRLQGPPQNPQALGAKVWVTSGETIQYQEVLVNKGFLSCSDPGLHFGLGNREKAEQVKVEFPDGKIIFLEDVEANQLLVLDQSNGEDPGVEDSRAPSGSFLVTLPELTTPAFQHVESPFIDFKEEPLIEQMSSNRGPFLATGDVNGDGLDDFYAGGSAGTAGCLYVQQAGQQFFLADNPDFVSDARFEDGQSLFFDADLDGDLDLFVTSGSNEQRAADLFKNRLYLNDGKGRFSNATDRLPGMAHNSLCVEVIDLEGDGDLDLFVGGHVKEQSFPLAYSSYLLVNNGGRFEYRDLLAGNGPIGIVNDAIVMDVNLDGRQDLIVAGEWMNITLLLNQEKGFVDATGEYGLSQTEGLWYCLELMDVDLDGDLDFVAGNRGTNTFFKVSPDHPGQIIAADFDQNGQLDATHHYYYPDGRQFPRHMRDNLLGQVPGFKRLYPQYIDYASVTTPEFLESQDQDQLIRKYLSVQESSVFLNNGTNGFVRQALPIEAQFSHVMDIQPVQVPGSSQPGILLVGNNRGVNVHQGRDDAGIGLLLTHNPVGWESHPVRTSGFYAPGETRQVNTLKTSGDSPIIVVSRNDDSLLFFTSSSNQQFSIQ